MAKSVVYSWDDLGLILNATQVGQVLGISRSASYELFHSTGFPTIYVGKRMLVSKEALKEWIEGQEQT